MRIIRIINSTEKNLTFRQGHKMKTNLFAPIKSKRIQNFFASNPKVASIIFFKEGFVPNSYKWPAPAMGIIVFSDMKTKPSLYDRKRPYGAGSIFSAKSEKGGTLRSVSIPDSVENVIRNYAKKNLK